MDTLDQLYADAEKAAGIAAALAVIGRAAATATPALRAALQGLRLAPVQAVALSESRRLYAAAHQLEEHTTEIAA